MSTTPDPEPRPPKIVGEPVRPSGADRNEASYSASAGRGMSGGGMTPARSFLTTSSHCSA